MSEIFELSRTFDDLELRSSILKGIRQAGFDHPTHIQAQLIPLMLAGGDVLGQAKTGTGKTAAFGLPILNHAEEDGGAQALILAPTRELAVQIVRELNELGKFTPIRSAGVIGGEGFKKQINAIKTGAQIIVGTPGRVMDLHRRKQLDYGKLRWVVLDEVDRMLDIGFREDIRHILSGIRHEVQTVFVSATISEEIERLARKFMKADSERLTTEASSLTVSLVTQKYFAVQPWDKRRLLTHLLTHEEPALTVVFCRMKVTVRDVTHHLKRQEIDAFEIHGDLHQSKRNRIMKRLREGKLEVLVASDLAARGLDVPGITHIINYDLPEDPEIYVHRIGRTARAGASGTAWSFVTAEQGQLLTEIEKLTGVLIEKMDYPDFSPSDPPQAWREKIKAEQAAQKVAESRFTAPHHKIDHENPDPQLFPGGVAPKGPPNRTLGSRIRRKGRK